MTTSEKLRKTPEMPAFWCGSGRCEEQCSRCKYEQGPVAGTLRRVSELAPEPCLCDGPTATCVCVSDEAPPEESILEEALRLVDGARGADYGTPAANHGRTAVLWEAYLAARYGELAPPISADDVCWLNLLQKIARNMHRRKRDNYVDAAGWAENAWRVNP